MSSLPDPLEGKVDPSQADFSQMLNAVITLGGRVTDLSRALNTVGNLQIAAVAETETIKKAVDAVEKDHEEKWIQEQKDLIKLRRRIKRQTYIVGAIFFLLSLLALGITTKLITNQQTDITQQQTETCKARQTNSVKAVQAYNSLLKSPTIDSDPTLRGFIQAARDAAVRGVQIKC